MNLKEIEGINPSNVLGRHLEKEFDNISKLVAIICEAPVVLITLIKEDSFYLKSQYGNNFTTTPIDLSIYQSVLEEPNKIFHIKNVRENIYFQDQPILMQNPKLVSYWGCALVAEDGFPLGVISILDERTKELKSSQKEALLILSSQAVNLLITTKQLQNVEKEVEERTQTIANIVACTTSGTWCLNLNTNGLVLNEEWAQLLGYTLGELGPINFDSWKSLVHPQDFEAADENLVSFSLGKTKVYDVEFRMLHKKGHWIWIRSKGKVIEFSKEGKPLLLFGTHTDIDEKKKLEIDLIKEKERFEYVSKATSDTLWDLDLTNNTIYFDENYKDIFGFKPSISDTEHSKNWEQRLHPEERKIIINNINRALESDDETWEYEYRFQKYDNTYAHIIDKAYIVRDKRGRAIRVVGSVQDITFRKESELQLKVFESIINKTKDSIIITKAEPIHAPLGPEIIYVNDAVVERTGYTKEELIGKTPRIFQGPNTDPATIKDISEKLKKREIIDVDIVNYSKTNKEYWINLSIVPVVDEYGEFKYFISIQKDITDRKNYLRAIEESQKNYSNLFQLSPQPLVIYDIDTLTILNVNEAACHLYGFDCDEFMGMSILDIRPESAYSHLRNEVEKIKNLPSSSETYIGLFEHQKKNGEIFTVEVYNNVASQEKQNIRISLINDVSERVKYTKEIENQNERLKDIAWIQSHKVRAPLARIIGLIDMISNTKVEVDEEEQKYMFKGVIDSAYELDEIIKDITIKASSIGKE
jgi:PAS domain S-box-containing protein